MLQSEYLAPDVALPPQQAFYADKKAVPLEQSIGEICSEFVMCGNPDSCPRRTNHFGYCELYPVRQGKGLFSDRAAGYGDCEIECGEEVGLLDMLAW